MDVRQQEVQFSVIVDHDYFNTNIADLMNTYGSQEYAILLDGFIKKTIDIEVDGIVEIIPDYGQATTLAEDQEHIEAHGLDITIY